MRKCANCKAASAALWRVAIDQHSRWPLLVYDNSSFGLQLLVHALVHFNDVAGRIIEEDLIPTVHRPLAIVGIGNVLFLEPRFESFNVIGAESDVAAVKRIDDLIGSEADVEVGRGQVKLGVTVRREGDRGRVTL